MLRALRATFPTAKFRHQVPFGTYHADFCSHGAKLVIEVDDASHAEKVESDAARTRFLDGEGYRVIRFWNNDVMANIDGVIAIVAGHLPDEIRGAARG